MTNLPICTDDHLMQNLQWLLDTIPEKDADLVCENLGKQFFGRLDGRIGSIELIWMQLASHNAQLDAAFREGVRALLQDESSALNMPTRLFISDLLTKPPVTKVNKTSCLVRDVMIISAILILQEMGYATTRKENESQEEYSAFYAVFEYLVLRRKLEFADNVGTIEQIWKRRQAKFDRLGLRL